MTAKPKTADQPKKAERAKQSAANFINEVVREITAFWRLIVTIAQAMAAYILIPQDTLAFRIVGGVLVLNAAYSAVVHYTRK